MRAIINNKIRALLLAFCLCPVASLAQTHQFSLDGDFMERGELRIGGNDTDPSNGKEDFAAFILGRVRLTADYQLLNEKGSPIMETRFSGQYCGTWGAESSALNIFEGWAKVYWGKGFSAKLGRQVLSYDDQRIFGSDDWSMTGISHDGLKLSYEGHGHKVHLFGAFNQNLANISGGTYYTGGIQPYKGLAALWYHWELPKIPLGISVTASDIMMEGEPSVVDVNLNQWEYHRFHQQLIGTYLNFHPKKWGVEASYYKQMGKEEGGLPLNAWMASGKVKFSPSEKWTFTTGFDYLSGDPDFAVPPGGMIGMQRHEVVKGFSSIYGSHHKFYGAMDFFYMSAYYGGFTPGLQNAYAGATWKPAKALSLDLAYHFLATAAKLRNAEQPLGHEVEFSASYDLGHGMSLSTGYTFMRGTETMVILKRTSDKRELHWCWLMFRATPKFLQSKR